MLETRGLLRGTYMDLDAIVTRLGEQLPLDEGVRKFVYDDATGQNIHAGSAVKGNPTIGIGRNLAAKGLTSAEITYLNRNDCTEVVSQLNQHLPWYGGIGVVRQAALGNMGFNLGWAGLLSFHEMLTHMSQQAWGLAADSIRASKWYTQVGARAERIAQEIETGA
jgi:lysozyme